MIKKTLKRISLIIGGITLIVSLKAFLFMSFAPQFGGKISKEQKKRFELLDHYENGEFLNTQEVSIKLDCHSVTEMIKEAVSSIPNTMPKKEIEVEWFDVKGINKNFGYKTRLTWLGHSSFLMEMDGKVILIDPVFSDYAAPHELLGRKRFTNGMPFEVSDLEQVHAIIISHDHYDHLDYNTIKQIKDKIKNVIVPLGIGNHFKKWGVASEKIQELNWWEETQLGTIKIALTPSRHGSGRGISDQNATLWGSWCFLGVNQKIFYSGDGGYGDHFKAISEKYGSFDFAMIECGQYDVKWADIHMMPEESVQAGLDVRATTFMPAHWGAFRLANHTWTDPVERFRKKSLELGVSITTPAIGQSILIPSDEYPNTEWWKKFD